MISRRKAWKIQEDRTMIKLIVGTKGSGKTKAMIDQINDAVKTSKGNVVVVEKGILFVMFRLHFSGLLRMERRR